MSEEKVKQVKGYLVLSEEEAKALVAFVDVAVKETGLQYAGAALSLTQKINASFREDSKKQVKKSLCDCDSKKKK